MKYLTLILSFAFLLSACVTPKKKSAKKAKKQQALTAEVTTQPPLISPTPTPTPASDKENCFAQEQLGSQQPWVAGKTGFVVTGITKPCKSDDKPGFSDTSDFILMGVPCTHGEGRIDWKGTNYQKPKMVSFLLDTNCAFMPENLQPALQEIRNLTSATTHKGRILAVNPLSVQYWKLDDFEDEDPSPYIEFRTAQTLDKAWTKLTKNEALAVTLLGRENAWSGSNAFYEVKATIIHAQKNRFKLNVSSIKILNDGERKNYEAHCADLKPKRDCSVFKS